jgi:aldose 1-epimerase
MPVRSLGGASFGQTSSGTRASLYRLRNRHMRAAVTDYGGRLVSLETPDRDGRWGHVVLGFDSAQEYERCAEASFGGLLGRTANRIGGGRFTLEGATYELSRNEGANTLHGGNAGFDKIFWQVAEAGEDCLALHLTSPDGDQGYPGELSLTATYRLVDEVLWLDFTAVTTRPTPVSLSAHPYFNLDMTGTGERDVLDHQIEIAAELFLPTDAQQIPTGEIRHVHGTPFDFRNPTAAGERIRQPDPQLLIGRGYDHYFVLPDNAAGTRQLAARVFAAKTGRVLEIITTQPGLQFYTGNNLNGSIAGRGGIYRQSAGLAFEPQGFPDAVNHPAFPATILGPNETYRQTIGYRFVTG